MNRTSSYNALLASELLILVFKFSVTWGHSCLHCQGDRPKTTDQQGAANPFISFHFISFHFFLELDSP